MATAKVVLHAVRVVPAVVMQLRVAVIVQIAQHLAVNQPPPPPREPPLQNAPNVPPVDLLSVVSEVLVVLRIEAPVRVVRPAQSALAHPEHRP